MKNKTISNSYHAHHSPVGAHSSFTLGHFGHKGGFALEGHQPADQSFYIGLLTNDKIKLFPFFDKAQQSEASAYDHGKNQYQNIRSLEVFEGESIQRELLPASDSFSAEGLRFNIGSPFFPLNEPLTCSEERSRFELCPALYFDLSYENKTNEPVTVFFMMSHEKPAYYSKAKGEQYFELDNGEFCLCANDDVTGFQNMGLDMLLEMHDPFISQGIAKSCGFAKVVPPGEKADFTFTGSFYKAGNVTRGIEMPYWYTRYFKSGIESASYALQHREQYKKEVLKRNDEFQNPSLDPYQNLMISHSIHSYMGSSQLLEREGKPFWIVNEGEYRMINTFDLSVDQLFFEMMLHPWTTRNVLETYVSDYSYQDKVFFPGVPGTLHEGGISFTHDMGSFNNFSPKHYSGYERAGLDRACFSYMTTEQLANWVLCASVYVYQSDDKTFEKEYLHIFEACLQSMLNRDNPEPSKRNGINTYESDRCLLKTDEGIVEGAEITTYDSLDHSLGQARANVYLMSKMWASMLALEELFKRNDKVEEAALASGQAKNIAQAITKAYDSEKGYIPAVLDGENQSAIIPLVEGLVFPWVLGLKDKVSKNGDYAEFVLTLEKHLKTILNSDFCRYDDGSWKLSSTADNSWMSKICLNQYICEEVFDLSDKTIYSFDKHWIWQCQGSKPHACSDQFTSGVAKGSLYYPRIVTSSLWLKRLKTGDTTSEIKETAGSKERK